MKEILELVEKYIKEKHKEKTWEAGKDWVQYAGPYFDSKEYVAAVKSLLTEWLVLGADANKFETKFPKKFGKQYGLLTNSGSSAEVGSSNSINSGSRLNALAIATLCCCPPDSSEG